MKKHSDQEFLRLQKHRARGIDFATSLFGPIVDIIEEYARNKETVRILELGFGFGMLLFELSRTFGTKVDLVGINKTESDGNWETSIRSAVLRGIASNDDARKVIVPKLLYNDLNDGIPLPNNSFDIIISQVCLFNVSQKSLCIEETNRVLNFGGVAYLDFMINRNELPENQSVSLRVFKGNEEIDFWKYIRGFDNLKKWKHNKRNFLYLKKAEDLQLKLELVEFLDLAKLDENIKGINSIYSLR